MLLVPYSSTMWTMLARRPSESKPRQCDQHANDNPEHRECAAELVRSDAVERHQEGFGGMKLGSLIFIDSAARERDDRIEARGLNAG